MPIMILMNMVYMCGFSLKCYIPIDYISTHANPGTIVNGWQYDHSMMYSPGSRFGEFMQTHESTDNTM